MEEYLIRPVTVGDSAQYVNAVVVNQDGEWYAEEDNGQIMPVSDVDGDYIPAAPNWRKWIIRREQ